MKTIRIYPLGSYSSVHTYSGNVSMSLVSDEGGSHIIVRQKVKSVDGNITDPIVGIFTTTAYFAIAEGFDE